MKCDKCRFHFSRVTDGARWCDWHKTTLHTITGCDAGEPYASDDLDEPMPHTNYDRIINKTPKELALWLCDVAEWLPHYAGKAHAILEWLEQEAKE